MGAPAMNEQSQTVLLTLTPNETVFLSGAIMASVTLATDMEPDERAAVIRMARSLVTRLREACEERVRP